MRESANSRAGAGEAGEEQSQVQAQSWHTEHPKLLCLNDLQNQASDSHRLTTAMCCRAQGWLAEGQGRTAVCLHSLLSDPQGPSGY